MYSRSLIQFSPTRFAFIRPWRVTVSVRTNSKCGASSVAQWMGISTSGVSLPKRALRSSSMTSPVRA